MRTTVKYLIETLPKDKLFNIMDNIKSDDSYEHCKDTTCAIKYYLKNHINKYISDKEDPLKPIEVRDFSGKFSPSSDSNSYSNWYRSKSVHKSLKKYYDRKYYNDVYDAWDKIKDSLVNKDGEPAILYSSFHLEEYKSDLYFLYDSENNRIKIGVSNNVESRKKQIEYKLNCSLKTLFIEYNGGYERERELHEKFKKYRIYDKEIGREWFKPSDEIFEYIEKRRENKRTA